MHQLQLVSLSLSCSIGFSVLKQGLGISSLLLFTFCEFFTPSQLVLFSSSPSPRKSPQILRTLFSTLAALNNAVVWMVSILPMISRTLLSILADLNNAMMGMVSILPWISKTLLSILADLNSAVVWMVSILPLVWFF